MKKMKGFSRVFERIAAEHHTTAEEVYREMEAAIRTGFDHPDPRIRAQWAKIHRKGTIPTPEELIAYMIRQPDFLPSFSPSPDDNDI